jgi:hypothetical protein
MQMSRVTLVPTGRPVGPGTDTTLLTALLYAAAEPADALEHISVQPAEGQVEMVFFHAVDSPAEADAAGRELCRRALEAAGRIAEWARQ